jgi:hypothetical protein
MHLVQPSTSLRIPSTKKVFGWSPIHSCTAWMFSSLVIPGVSPPYFAFWILPHSDVPTFHLLWLFCSKILLCLHCCSGRVSVGWSHTHFYAVEHCSRILLKASDEFQPLTHLPTREIGSLFFVPPWCTLLAERPCLQCHSSKENDAIIVKLRPRDHISTNTKDVCADVSVTNLKRCYGESADNFLLTYVEKPRRN